jgi:hypothetical protein
MTPEEKLYNSIKNWIIEKDGYNFLKLSEKDQHNIILAVIQTHIKEK